MTRFLVTSALPYVNGVKHLGNLIGSLLPADVHARFRRQVGDDVLFICGTDEHGTPAELGALLRASDGAVAGMAYSGGSLLQPASGVDAGTGRDSLVAMKVIASLCPGRSSALSVLE